MQYDKQFSLEEHFEMADSLATVDHHMDNIYHKIQDHFPKNHPLSKAVSKITPVVTDRAFMPLWSELGRTVTNDQFNPLSIELIF